MTDVKVVLGFLELALAVKFFSNADLVKQWGLLKREIFIGIWILIGIADCSYTCWVRLEFPHSSPVKKFSFVQNSIYYFICCYYHLLVPGLTNTKWANLKLISGFPPPRML